MRYKHIDDDFSKRMQKFRRTERSVDRLFMRLILQGVPVPVKLRFAKPMNDGELIRFSEANGNLRVEQEASGEVCVRLPAGTKKGLVSGIVGSQVYSWARKTGLGNAFGPNAGFKLPDMSVRAASAA